MQIFEAGKAVALTSKSPNGEASRIDLFQASRRVGLVLEDSLKRSNAARGEEGGKGELRVQIEEGILTIGRVVKTYVPPSESVDDVGEAAASPPVGLAEVESPAEEVVAPASLVVGSEAEVESLAGGVVVLEELSAAVEERRVSRGNEDGGG